MWPSALNGTGAAALEPQEAQRARALSASARTHYPPSGRCTSVQREAPFRLVGAPQRGHVPGVGASVAPGTTTTGASRSLGLRRVPMFTRLEASLHGPVCSKPGMWEGRET